MIKKMVLFVVIFLFVGAAVASSSDNLAKDNPSDYSPLKSVYSSKGIFSHDTTWYEFISTGSDGTGFYAFYTNGTYRFREWEGDGSFSGGTWTNDGRYLCCMYGNGTLYDINPETFDAYAIGDGGVSLNGLAYNPVSEKLYGASDSDLYEINIATGEQTHIGAFGTGTTMIAIAFDLDGICYGWDVKFSGESYLYKINTNTGVATLVGGMGITLCFAQDGCFDYCSDTLYLVAYSAAGFLLECDEDTGDCTWLSGFQGEATAHAISYELEPPVTTISFDPPEPDGCNGWYISDVTVALEANDDTGVNATYYRINGGDWEVYESPFIISEEGNDILIEYYSVDNIGNIEDVKSATLDIDKKPPEMNVEWDVEKIGWNKWRITFTITIINETSGIDRIEIFVNDALQATLTGPGPTYSWSFVISGDSNFSFKFVAIDQACNQAVVIVNASDINSYPTQKSVTYQTKSVQFLECFEKFPLIQRLLEILGGMVE